MEEENEVQGQELAHEPTPPDTDSSGSQESDLYAPYLEKFPESLHPIAREVFKEWDGNVTQRFQKVQQEYEPYKPFIEQYEPEAIDQALRAIEAMEADPQQFLQAFQEHFGLTPQQAQQELANQYEVQPDFDPSDPDYKLQQHEDMLRALAETLLSEREQREQEAQYAEEEAVYEETMASLHEKYGEFDVLYVNTLLANGVEPDTAVGMWQQAVGQYAQRQLAPNQNAPVVMGAGGGTPSIQRDTENLSSQDTRKLVEDMLRAASQQQG